MKLWTIMYKSQLNSSSYIQRDLTTVTKPGLTALTVKIAQSLKCSCRCIFWSISFFAKLLYKLSCDPVFLSVNSYICLKIIRRTFHFVELIRFQSTTNNALSNLQRTFRSIAAGFHYALSVSEKSIRHHTERDWVQEGKWLLINRSKSSPLSLRLDHYMWQI